jgi:hypothetical protein
LLLSLAQYPGPPGRRTHTERRIVSAERRTSAMIPRW